MLRLAGEREAFQVVNGQQGCPTWPKILDSTLAGMCGRVKLKGFDIPWGGHHYCGAGETIWHGIAQGTIEEARVIQK